MSVPMTYNCDKCKYHTSFKQNLNKHLNSKKHTTEIANNHKCKKCNDNFSSATTLWRHNKTCVVEESKEKEFKDKINKDAKLLCCFSKIIVDMLKKYNENGNFIKNHDILNISYFTENMYNEDFIKNIEETVNTIINTNFNKKNNVNIDDFIKKITQSSTK
jgi:hypothetical protein